MSLVRLDCNKCTFGLLVFPPSVLIMLLFHTVLHNLTAPQASLLMGGYENNCKLAPKCSLRKLKEKWAVEEIDRLP